MFIAFRHADDAALTIAGKAIGNGNEIEFVSIYHFDSIKHEEIVRLEMRVQQIFNCDLYQEVYLCFGTGRKRLMPAAYLTHQVDTDSGLHNNL